MAIKIEEFDWDEGNKTKNKLKHKVSIKEAEQVFFDRTNKTFEDKEHSQSEIRYKVLGVTKKKRKLHITFTVRFGKIRVISARDMSKRERVIYEND